MGITQFTVLYKLIKFIECYEYIVRLCKYMLYVSRGKRDDPKVVIAVCITFHKRTKHKISDSD